MDDATVIISRASLIDFETYETTQSQRLTIEDEQRVRLVDYVKAHGHEARLIPGNTRSILVGSAVVWMGMSSIEWQVIRATRQAIRDWLGY